MQKDVYELTNPQKSILYTDQFYKNTSVNNICGTVLINETVDFKLLERAVNLYIEHCDNYRIRIKLDSKDQPIFYIRNYEDQHFSVVNISSIDEIKNYAKKLVTKPFTDIYDIDLFRMKFFKLPNGHGGLLCVCHHLITDAWSISSTASIIMDYYSKLVNNTYSKELDETYSSYIDFAKSEKEYLSSEKYLEDQKYWESILSSSPIPGTITSYENTSVDDSFDVNAERLSYTISSSLTSDLTNYCTNNKISLFNFFMGIFAIYIHKISNQDNFVLGTPILNRTNFKEKNTQGLFISTNPLVFNINDSITFTEFIKTVGKQSMQMLRHQRFPYQKMLEFVRKKDPSSSNLYEILISFQNAKTNRQSSSTDYVVNWDFNQALPNALQVHFSNLNDVDSLCVDYDFLTSKYTQKDIEKIHDRLQLIIKNVLSNKDISIKDITLVSNTEKKIILNDFNNTSKKYDLNKHIPTYIEEHARKTPNDIAIVCEDKTLTYKELNEKANQLANYLKSKGVKQRDVLGIMLTRSTELIVSLLAVLKLGCTYLPLDPEYPQERISYILKDSNAKTILVNNKTQNVITDYSSYRIFNASDESLYENQDNKNFLINIGKNDVMYLIYTSGSTGNPKGVMITYRNANNFILGMKDVIDFNKKKVMVSVTTICFDIFVLELWCSLTSGLKVVLATEMEQINPSLLRKLCIKNNVTMIQTTPSRYSSILGDNQKTDYFKNFTDIMVGGEPFPKPLLDKLRKFTQANIFNLYGPTETTVWSTAKQIKKDDPITIGKPLPNQTCYVLDKNMNLLPIGVPGELYIGGEGVTLGYWNKEALTNQKFVPSPFKANSLIYNTNDLAYFKENGELVHLGRTDFQVKIRGYRIELEEIQNKILTFKGITDAVVIAKDGKYLVCYYVSHTDISSADLSAHLLKYLPSYMVPAYFVKLSSIPLTPNGKLNRKLLPDINVNDNNFESPNTEGEILLAKVLKEILKVDSININSSFLDLGLDSLGILTLQTALLKYNIVLSTQTFYKYSTIKSLAKIICGQKENDEEEDIQIPNELKHYPNELLDFNNEFNADETILNNVLLTGANGFLGAHILHTLLKTTNEKVYCLVRQKDNKTPQVRLKEVYRYYFNEDLGTYIKDNRVVVVSGSLDEENFGLNLDKFNEYTNDFNTIIHTAAITKHYGDYSMFKKINVEGTRRVTEFALSSKKRLIHISSISVSGNYLVNQNNRNIEFSENSLYIGQHYTDNVYVRSKLEAEKIVLAAMKKGLCAQIHRIGILAGRYSDGNFQRNMKDNAFYNRIRFMLNLGEITKEMLNQKIEFTPVDLCAEAVVNLSKNSACNNKVFHVYNHNLVPISKLISILEHIGFNIKIVSTKDFNKKLKDFSNLGSIVNDLVEDSDHNLVLNYNYTVNITSAYTLNYLSKFGFKWEVIDEPYISRLINFMTNEKFI